MEINKRRLKNLRKKQKLKQDLEIRNIEEQTIIELYNEYDKKMKDVDSKKEYIHKEAEILERTFLDNQNNEEIKLKIKALQRIIDRETYVNENPIYIYDTTHIERDIQLYPSPSDKDFNKKIFLKKEFHDYQYPPFDEDKTFEEIANEKCGVFTKSSKKKSKDFELSNPQHFIKNFISPHTPYNSILLYYGVGVGKTCSSISIAEQFRKDGNYKKIYVLLSPSIEENYKKQLFDVEKFYEQFGYLGCTGDTFLKEIDNKDKYISDAKKNGKRGKTKTELQKKIAKFIKRNYIFMGYDRFAGYVFKLEEDYTKGFEKSVHHNKISSLLKKKFSDCVIIIDEAHHLRNTSTESKYAPPIIERVLRYSQNTKLILLTATPMFDNPQEIISLLNLMLVNDNRNKINVHTIFDKENNITDIGKKLLINKLRGYISYVRGENPFIFPIRLEADINDTDEHKIGIIESYPDYDINGKMIQEENKIDPKITKIIGCQMSDEHYFVYSQFTKQHDIKRPTPKEISITSEETSPTRLTPKSIKTKIEATGTEKELSDIDVTDIEIADLSDSEKELSDIDVTDIEIADLSDSEKEWSDIDVTDIEIADIGKDDPTDIQTGGVIEEEDEHDLTFNISVSLQLSNIFYNTKPSISYGRKGLYSIVSREDRDSFTYNNDVEIFSPANIGTYSCKIKKIIDTIQNSKGIIFIYSQFIDSGLIPLALALEHHGYIRYDNKQLLKSANKVKPTTPLGNYIMITSDTGIGGLSSNIKKHLNVLNSVDNNQGQKIKIVLGSPAASEGLSFLRVREIHILEPWHNINRIEQVIGRGLRNCSHKDLPIEERNVTIYYYASITKPLSFIKSDSSKTDSDTITIETIDLKTYREASNKMYKIAAIEDVIKKAAIDCNLMKENNYIQPDKRLSNRKIITSKNNVVKFDYYDKDYSRNCHFKKCDYQCIPTIEDIKNEPINLDTYTIQHASNDIKKIKKMIKKMYSKSFIYRIEDITKEIKENIPFIQDIFIYKSLEDFIVKTDTVIDQFQRSGYLIHRGPYYIFQPYILDDETIPMYYRRNPLRIKNKKFDIYPLVKDIKTPERIVEDIYTIDQIKAWILSFDNIINRSMIFERLEYHLQLKIYDDFILNRNREDEFQQFIQDNYSSNFIRNRDIDISGKEKDDVIGYRIGNSKKKLDYYCLTDGQITKCGGFTLNKIKDRIRKQPEKKAILVGFMERMKTLQKLNKTIKDIDFTNFKELKNIKTNMMMKLLEDKQKGFVCIRARRTKDNLLLYLNAIDDKDVSVNRKNTKIQICDAIEYKLRQNDKAQINGKRWFYTFEEAISLGIFQTKKTVRKKNF